MNDREKDYTYNITVHAYSKKDYKHTLGLMKWFIEKDMATTLRLACNLYLFESGNIEDSWKKDYSDIYDFAKRELDISRKRVNELIDVIYIYYDCILKEVRKEFNEEINVFEFVVKNEYFSLFNFSLLRACKGMSVEELKKLDIDFTTSVHEARKKIIGYKSSINKNEVACKEDQMEDQAENKKNNPLYNSYHDLKNDIDIFKNNYIPDNSEYEFIFREDETLIKGSKKKYNYNTALKILRSVLENNPENDYYYGIVKIKKPL